MLKDSDIETKYLSSKQIEKVIMSCTLFYLELTTQNLSTSMNEQ